MVRWLPSGPCTALYTADGALRGFFAFWKRQRRCPLELVDYLLDRDLSGPAEAARWAATAPVRHVPGSFKKSGPFPYRIKPSAQWPKRLRATRRAWSLYENADELRLAPDYVPMESVIDPGAFDNESNRCRVIDDALLLLLNHWRAP